jgi:hypothetical protein
LSAWRPKKAKAVSKDTALAEEVASIFRFSAKFSQLLSWRER